MPELPDYLKQLDADGILDLDQGALRNEVNRQIGNIMRDIADRPCNADLKTETRKLTLSVEFHPQVKVNKATRSAELFSIEVEPVLKIKSPDTRGGRTEVKVKRGVPVFNLDTPDSVDQIPLPFDETEAAGHDAAS